MKSERSMSATISPLVVQLAFGWGTLGCAHRLAIGGPLGQAATEDIEMFARKGVFSSHGRAAVMATVAAIALTAVEPSLALAGPAASGEVLRDAAPTSER